MRLFIAVNLSPEMKNALTDAQRMMYDRGVRGRFTPEENLHLTLAFIGEYPSADAVSPSRSGWTASAASAISGGQGFGSPRRSPQSSAVSAERLPRAGSLSTESALSRISR